MPDCYSSSGYLELFQFFPRFSEDQWPREQPEWCSRRPSQLQPPEHHSPAKWCRVPSPTVTEWSQAEEHQMQELILCRHFDSTDLCQLSYESQVAGQTWFDSWETVWGNSSLSLLSEQFQTSTEYFFSKRNRDTREQYMHAWAHLWATCTGWEIEMNNHVFSSWCIMFITQRIIINTQYCGFSPSAQSNLGNTFFQYSSSYL